MKLAGDTMQFSEPTFSEIPISDTESTYDIIINDKEIISLTEPSASERLKKYTYTKRGRIRKEKLAKRTIFDLLPEKNRIISHKKAKTVHKGPKKSRKILKSDTLDFFFWQDKKEDFPTIFYREHISSQKYFQKLDLERNKRKSESRKTKRIINEINSCHDFISTTLPKQNSYMIR